MLLRKNCLQNEVDVKGQGGAVIRKGYDKEFDRLREMATGGKLDYGT